MHFREPVGLNEKSLLQKANLDKSIDFLDTMEEDIPKGMLLSFLMVKANSFLWHKLLAWKPKLNYKLKVKRVCLKTNDFFFTCQC